MPTLATTSAREVYSFNTVLLDALLFVISST
jgi:hypothetical protein